MNLSILIPAFNEAGSIQTTLSHLQAVCKKMGLSHEIVVIDDGSTDATASLVSGEHISLLKHSTNRGYGAALKTGLRHASGDMIVIIDADGTYPIDRIPDLVSELANADMVIGARTGEQVQIPLLRRPAKWLLGKLANYIANSPIPDLNSGLRAFRKDLAIRYMHLFPDGFSFTSTITLASICDGHEVRFIPINYHSRQGKSKIHPIRDTLNFLILLVRMAAYFEPLRIFMPAALISAGIALILIISSLIRDHGISDAGVLASLVTLLIFMMGILADVVVRRSRS